MYVQNSGLVILGIVITALPFVFLIISKLRGFVNEILSFKNLSIHTIERNSRRGIPHVMMKSALVGKEDVIVDDLIVQSKLAYSRRYAGFWAWLQLGIGYLSDDVEGLNSVLGKSFPSIVWIPHAPVYRINNSYFRKPLSVIFGLITLYYFIICCIIIPLLPVLFIGPYWELKLFSGNEKVKLSKKDNEVELERPFILKPGFENYFTMSYRPSSLYIDTLFSLKYFVKTTKISYVKELPKFKKTKLPRSDEFTWKVTDILRVKVRGKMKGYNVKLGESYVNIHL